MALAVPVGRRSARQTSLLDGLVRLFLAEGFAQFTLDDLTRRLRCSKSTLYALADSREQLVVMVVRHFFREAAAGIEIRIGSSVGALQRISDYLDAVADELAPASLQFFADVSAFAPAREVYAQNTNLAAARIQELIRIGVASGEVRHVDAAFVGTAVAQVMAAINRGDVGAATGLDDAHAYRALRDLMVAALAIWQGPPAAESPTATSNRAST